MGKIYKAFLATVLFIIACTSLAANSQPLISKGVLDLGTWDFEQQGNLKLNGFWEFYWSELYTPTDFSDSGIQPDCHINVPGVWTGTVVNGKPIGNTGCATFRLVIKSGRDAQLIISFKEIISAYCVWFNGEKVIEVGSVAKKTSEAMPAYKLEKALLNFVKGENELIVQVSNYNHRANSFEYAPILGNYQNMAKVDFSTNAIGLILLGVLLIMAFYHLGLFFFRPQNLATLTFSVLCLLALVRILVTSNFLLGSFFPSATWNLVYSLKYATFYTIVPVLGLLIYQTFEVKRFKWVFYSLYMVSGLFLLTLFLPSLVYTRLILVWDIVALVYYIVVLGGFLLRYTVEKVDGAKILLFSVLLLALSTINDMLLFNDLVPTIELTPIGIFILILGQSLTLGKRFSSVYNKNEELATLLENQNLNLKSAIAERTKELENEKVKLAESNKNLLKYFTAIEHASAAIVITDTEGNLEYANPKFEKVTGYSLNEILGKNLRIMRSGKTPEHVYANLWETIKNGRVWMGEFINLKKNKEEFYEDVIISPIFDDNGLIVNYIAVKEDVTDLKKVLQALKESEEKYRLIAENTYDVIWTIDLSTMKYSYMSPSVFNMRGYTVAECMAQPFEETFTPDTYEKAMADLTNCIQQANLKPDLKFCESYKHYCKDGTTIDVEISASFICDEDNVPIKILGITRDITKRLQTEQALRNSEEKYRLIAENMRDVIWKIDIKTFKYNYISPSVFSLRGFTVEEAIQQSIEQSLTPDTYVKAMNDLQTSLKLAENIPDLSICERYKQPCKDGSEVDIELNAIFIRDMNNQPVEILGVTRDITNRIQIEQALKESEEKLAALLEEQSSKNRQLNKQLSYIYNNAGNAIAFFDFKGDEIIISSCNKLWANHYGYEPHEVEGQAIAAIKHHESIVLFRDAFKAIREEKKTVQEYIFLFGKHLQTFLFPVFGESNVDVVSCASFTYNISEKFEAELKAKETEQKFFNIFNKSRDAIVLLSMSLDIIEVNDSFFELYGQKEYLRSNIIERFIPYKYHKEIFKRVEKLKIGEPISMFEFELYKSNGALIPIEMSSSVINLNQEPMILCMIRDISDRKNMERTLTNVGIQIENRERRKLASDLHDNVGPLLSSMNMYLSVLSLKPNAEKQTEILNNTVRILKEAIASVREISNNLSPHALSNFGLESALNLFFETKKNLIELKININTGGYRFSEVKEAMIYNIIKEAFNNTLKYSCAQWVELKIDRKDEQINVLYRDNGIGFNLDEKLETIGTHLGLISIINRVKILDGDYVINTAPGKGFEMSISFYAQKLN